MPALESGAEAGIPDVMVKLVDSTKLEIRGSTLHALTVLDKNIGQSIKAAIVPARAAARRNVSVNRLKQIMLAMHNYHDTYKTFPPAAITGADGKTKHSSRVALLPFLDKVDLYNRYKMDEPWDSENNQAIMKEGAELFSVPGEKDAKGDGNCSYFALVGPGTVFDSNDVPTKIRDIIDGTSKTIGIVEAKRAIPWTKPEDIEYDPDKEIPKLGGYFDGGFNTGYMDGSVHFLPLSLDEATLRALFSRDGREAIVTDPNTDLPKAES